MKITGKTGVLGILGWPVEHSLSPAMQNEALSVLGLDYVYVPLPVKPEHLGSAVEGLRRAGVRGFNVTIPHKTAIIPFLDRISPEVELCGAVNTVRRDGEFLVGHNTDGAGLVASIREDLGADPGGAVVLVLGAGGAARGAVASLAAAGASRIIVANRTLERGTSLVEGFRPHFGGTRFEAVPLEPEIPSECLRDADILVNTTSVGMNGTSFDTLPLPTMKRDALVYDMVYVPAETPLLEAARRLGLRCANGIGMLAAQGEAAFSLWTGRKAPENVMKSTLVRELKSQ